MKATTAGLRYASISLGLLGAGLGGVIGYFAFGWLARQGLYAAVLPGALVGLGCGWLAKEKSLPLSVTCGVVALGLGVFSEWSLMPFIADGSFRYFLTHLHLLPPVKLLMLSLGGVFGFWFSLGRKRLASAGTGAQNQ